MYILKIIDFISDRQIWGSPDPWPRFDGYFAEPGKSALEIRDVVAKAFNIDMTARIDADLRGIADIIKEAHGIACRDFGHLLVEDITYVLCPLSPESVFVRDEMNGIGGFAARDAVLLYLNPVGDWKNLFLRVVLHETNHSIRYPFGDPYASFRDWVVLEGMAECYLAEKQPEQPLSPWVTAASLDDLTHFFPRVKNFWDGFHPPVGNAREWFYGSESLGISKWAGYALGYHLVSQHRKKHAHMRWIDYIKTSSKEFDWE